MPLNPSILVFDATIVAAGNSVTQPMEAMSYLSVQCDGGCTATITRVDTAAGAVLGGITSTAATVLPGAFKSLPTDWQFYNVAAAGGACKVCRG